MLSVSLNVSKDFTNEPATMFYCWFDEEWRTICRFGTQNIEILFFSEESVKHFTNIQAQLNPKKLDFIYSNVLCHYQL